MTGDRRPFQMSLAFMLFLLIVGGPLLGVIVPRIIEDHFTADPDPAPWLPLTPLPSAYEFVIEGTNSGIMDGYGEPWELDNVEPVGTGARPISCRGNHWRRRRDRGETRRLDTLSLDRLDTATCGSFTRRYTSASVNRHSMDRSSSRSPASKYSRSSHEPSSWRTWCSTCIRS
jgi:hypothetical protein